MNELLKSYPKAAQVVKQWLLEKMLDSLNDDKLPEEFKEFVRQQGIDDEKVSDMLQGSPRALFDVFDNHKVYISMMVSANGFVWGIDEISSTVYKTRKEAEKDAVAKAFEILNNKL